MPRTWKQRQDRKRQVWLASVIAKRLGVERANRTLFPAIARALGVRWEGVKKQGYLLVERFAEQEGIYHKSEVGQKPSAVKRRVERAQLAKRQLSDDVNADGFLASFQWRRLRMEVIKKRGARCECCGATPKDGATIINVDHIKPRRLFPELALEESNLQVLCNSCNHGKGNWDQTDWRVS